jgi:pimeloyl-ACP methyl ester carboxylesterase
VNPCTEHRISLQGDSFCWFEWGQPGAGQETILLVHATGFHARCWNQTVALLGDRHVISIDMRGHGRSTRQGPFDWAQMGLDLSRFVDELQLSQLVAAGHSMGGHSLIQAAASLPDAFNRLLLVDPVVKSEDSYALVNQQWGRPEDHPVSRRRTHFASAEEFMQTIGHKGGFRFWQPEVLRDYCQYGLLPTAAGFELACPPLVEAAIYMGSNLTNIYDQVRSIDIPVTVLRARQAEGVVGVDFSISPTWPGLADQFRQGFDVYLPHLTHFIPMQDPRCVADHLLIDAANDS